MRALRALPWLLYGAVLGGCQTPPAVYELAEKTSASAGTFQQRLGEMAFQSKVLAARRADNVASMDALNAELDSYLKRELYMREKASAAGEWPRIDALIRELTSLRDELVAIENAAKFSQQDRRASVLALHADLNAFHAAMRDAATALNALAKQESDTERAAFLGKFLLDVQESVHEELKASDAAAQAAKGLVDKVKAELQSSAQRDSDGQE